MTVIKGLPQLNRKKQIKKISSFFTGEAEEENTEQPDLDSLVTAVPRGILKNVKKSSGQIRKLAKIKNVIAPKKEPEISASDLELTLPSEQAMPVQPVRQQAPMPSIDPSMFEDEAAAYRSQMKQQIDQEMSQYRQQMVMSVEQEKQQLLNQGYQEGVEKGKQEGYRDYQDKANDLFAAINLIQKERNTSVVEMEEDIIKLSLKVAETIIQKELDYDQDIIIGIVKEALVRITDKEKVIIKVSPAQVSVIRERQNEIHELMPDIKSLSIQADERVKPGGCIIETRLGFVDSSIKTKLETIEAAIQATFDDSPREI